MSKTEEDINVSLQEWKERRNKFMKPFELSMNNCCKQECEETC